MDHSSGKETKDFPKGTGPKTKLPSIHKSVEHWRTESSRSALASTSGSEKRSHETLFPQIENYKNRLNSFGMGMCTNNNAKTNSSEQKQSSDALFRERPSSAKAKKREHNVAASSSEQSDSTDSKSQPAPSMRTQEQVNAVTVSTEQTQSIASRSFLKLAGGTSTKVEVNVIDSSEDSQSTETPRSRLVSAIDNKNLLNPQMDLLQPNQSTGSPRSRRVSIIDKGNVFYLSTDSSDDSLSTGLPRSKSVSVVDKGIVSRPKTGSSKPDKGTVARSSRLVSIMDKGNVVSHKTGSLEEVQRKEALQISKPSSTKDAKSNLSVYDAYLVDDSIKSVKLRKFKKRSTMTLLSPTPADIEDAISRHGPYEGDLPVIRTEQNVDDDHEALRSRMSLGGVMSVIDQVSFEELGFDPDELVRTDPTVAKAVCELLTEYTDEDAESLKIITLALCDDKLSNKEVLEVIEENVKGRIEDNKTVYFAVAFFISKTQDPTRIQSSNSALTDENEDSPGSSQTQMRSNRSVSFLMNVLDKYMLLAQRAASMMSSEATSDASFMQHRQSFQVIAAAATRMSFLDKGRRQSDASSFDFHTPSGWFFDEVDVDNEIVETIRKSLPALMAIVEKEILATSQNAHSWSDKKGQIQAKKAAKKSSKRLKTPRTGNVLLSEGAKLTPRLTFEGNKNAPAALKIQGAIKVQKAKEGGSRQRTTKKLRNQQEKKNFSGWDLAPGLAPHWLNSLPRETDLIVPLLQNIQQHVRDGSPGSEPGLDRASRARKQSMFKSRSRKSQSKSVKKPPVPDPRGESTEDKMSGSPTATGGPNPEDVEAHLGYDLKLQSPKDLGMVSELQQDLDKREALPAPSPAALVLPTIRSRHPGPPPYTVDRNPKESALNYLCKHEIFELFADLISHLVLTTPSNPLDTLIDRVHQMNCLQGSKKQCPTNPVP